jgi:hypothetical protein
LNNRTIDSIPAEKPAPPVIEVLDSIRDEQFRSNIIQANKYLFELYETCIFKSLYQAQRKVTVVQLVGEHTPQHSPDTTPSPILHASHSTNNKFDS